MRKDTIFYKVLFSLLLLVFSSSAFAENPPTRIYDEGSLQGVFFNLDCVGAGITCSQSGITGTLNVTAGGAGLAASDIDRSSEIAAIVGDETGSGQLVFNNAPTMTSLVAQTAFTFEQSNGTDIMTGASGGIKITGDLNITNHLSGNTAAFSGILNANSISSGTSGTGTLDIGSAGVRMTDDGDGALTILGKGNGNDEDIKLNLDDGVDGANTIEVTSSTGMNQITFTSIDLKVPTEVYDATGWNGDLTVPTKDAVRDKIETITGASGLTSADIDRSSEIAAIVGDETGTGQLVFNNSPMMTSITSQVNFTVEQTGGTDIMTAATGGVKLTDDLILPVGANPNMDTSGKINIDTSNIGQFIYMSGATARIVAGTESSCVYIENLASTDDNWNLPSYPYPVTILKVWCECEGTCTTPATLSFEDDAANAMTLTGTPTCATSSTIAGESGVTAGGSLNARESWQFDVTNTPSPDTDKYSVCYEYKVDRQ